MPEEIVHHPSVVKLAEKKGKKPGELILDQTYHHSAILNLRDRGAGRGRPDIAHLSLLLALGSPLNHSGELRCYIHTRENRIITIDPRTRLPRNTDRFTSLLEQLYTERNVPLSGPPLLSIRRGSVQELVAEKSRFTIALTTKADLMPLEEVALRLVGKQDAALVIGGFPTGHFSAKSISAANESYSIDQHSLEAWTVVARAVYDCEKAIVRKSMSSRN